MRLGVTMRKGIAALSGILCVVAAGVARTEPPPRPKPLDTGDPASPPPWKRSIDIGIDLALVARPAASIVDGKPSPIRFDPAVGYGFHGRIDVLRYLRFSGYFVSAEHGLELPRGSLGLGGDLELDSVSIFSFGARLMPTWPFSDRLRGWVSVGAGWGRLELDRMKVKELAGHFEVRERSASFVEIPLGIGASFDIVPRWLALEFEVTGAFVVGEQGSLVQAAQAVDAAGKIRSIGSFPTLDASFVQTIGLSILL